ncbi:MAG TPA: dTDP-4-dehydrorhamnose 3,5-epimerase family protein [Jiangellales bacterium]|nr:dTDP-4-dehydrorhamnose 3,5-epimerase family protein [Jiangellales bacterium]
MRVRDGDIAGVLLLEPEPVRDDRGWFSRTFDAAAVRAAGLDPGAFVQDSQSRSRYGVVRGLHARRDGGEGKLVRCSTGKVWDVAVDLRPWSPTFLRTQELLLDDETLVSVYLPPGLAHGFQALTPVADVCYRIDRAYEPGFDVAVRWDDPALAVRWPLPVGTVSARDAAAPMLDQVLPLLADWFPAPAVVGSAS